MSNRPWYEYRNVPFMWMGFDLVVDVAPQAKLHAYAVPLYLAYCAAVIVGILRAVAHLRDADDATQDAWEWAGDLTMAAASWAAVVFSLGSNDNTMAAWSFLFAVAYTWWCFRRNGRNKRRKAVELIGAKTRALRDKLVAAIGDPQRVNS